MISIEIVKEILASDIIGWALAFIGGFIVFKSVDNMQTTIERHKVIKEVETEINKLFSEPIAKSNNNNKREVKNVNVRTVLHDNSPWEEYVKDKTKVIFEDTQKYVEIRSGNECNEYISTQAIHESLILFRRLEKLYKDSIIKPIDLADLWREILPFGVSGRLEFYKTYLHESDIKSILFVLFNTFLACEKYKVENGVKYFLDNFYKNEENKKNYKENNRYTFKEKLRVNKFYKIIEKTAV